MVWDAWNQVTEKNQNLVILILLTVGTVVGGLLMSICAYFLSDIVGDVKETKAEQIAMQKTQERMQDDIKMLLVRSDDRFTGTQAKNLIERLHSLEVWKAGVEARLAK